MVKIPGFGDLKKIGTDIIDSAKTVKLGEMVDKVKTSVGSVGKKSSAAATPGDDQLKNALQNILGTVSELNSIIAAEANLVKKMQKELTELARMADSYQKIVVANEEDKKNDEPKATE